MANFGHFDHPEPVEPNAFTDWHVENLGSALGSSIGPAALRPAHLALGRRMLEWHRQHGVRVPHPLCAGCGEPIGVRQEALDLADNNRVHFVDGYECLIRYGERWRSTARAAMTETAVDGAWNQAAPRDWSGREAFMSAT